MSYQYEVALSFAGEDREFAEAVAIGLRDESVEVFYDDFFASDLWGEDLSVKLRDVYYADSRYCIMVLSQPYFGKMWTSFERQQAIERLLEHKGSSYVLPVRLDGFQGEVPGMSNLMGYLSVRRNEPHKVVDNFLNKIGKSRQRRATKTAQSGTHTFIPRLKKSYTDREKNKFIRESFDEIAAQLEHFATETHNQHAHFDHEIERISSRKILFTLYNNDDELTRFQLWFGGPFGEHTICLSHGRHTDVGNDGSISESLSMVEHEGELKMSPMGMAMLGQEINKHMTSHEAAEYIWQIVCRSF